MPATTSYREICETIAAFITELGVTISGREVFELSPTGGLWLVHDLYHRCVAAGMEPIAAMPTMETLEENEERRLRALKLHD